MNGRRAREIRRLAALACADHGVPEVSPEEPYLEPEKRVRIRHGAPEPVQFPVLHREGPRRLARVVRRYYARYGELPRIVGGQGRG